jgi:P4 family phage/plasmid primase-like protien
MRKNPPYVKRASAERTVPFSQDGRIPEAVLVELLLTRIPPMVSRGSEWFAYEEGIWKSRRRIHYAPEALEIIPGPARTNRLADEVLKHAEKKCQLKKDILCGAYKFDGNDILLCVNNGVLRITPKGDCSIEDFSKDHFFTEKIVANYEPEATAVNFTRTLREALPDPEDRKLFLRFGASIFIPDSRFEAALCCYGQTGTGKSTLMEGILATLGSEICKSLSLSQLCDTECYALPKLQYAMLNISTELDALELDSEQFKKLVSGEPMVVRQIYEQPYEMRSSSKYVFLTNHLPRFKGGTDAELRRLRFLRFAEVPADKDILLKKKVAAEGAGILNLLITYIPSLLELSEIPTGAAQSVSARERFKIGNDPFGYFVEHECELNSDSWEAKDTLKTRCEAFLERNALPTTLASGLFRQLYERYDLKPGRPRKAGDRGHTVAGINLKPVWEEVDNN